VITFDEGSDAAACCGETAGFSPDQPDVGLPHLGDAMPQVRSFGPDVFG